MIEYLILFIFGLLIGSFINVVVFRETHQELAKEAKGLEGFLPAWVWGRSYCDSCRAKLMWYHNLPLISYLVLRGRCSFCKNKIPLSYPFVEFLTACEFVWVYWLLSSLSFFQQMEGFYSFGVLFFWLFIFSLSITLAIIDMKKSILPDSLVFSGIALSLLRLLFTGRWEFLITAFVLFLVFLCLYLVTMGRGIGFGDVKLAFFIGLVLGNWQWVVVSLFLSFMSGSLVGIALIVLGKKNMKSALPFGPFLLGSMLVTKIWGDYLWTQYMILLGFN